MTINDCAYPVEVKTQNITYSDSPTALNLVTIIIDLQKKHLSYSELKQALRTLQHVLLFEVKIDRPSSPYDCTGQSFTSGLDQIDRLLFNTGDQLQLIAVYKHYIGLDV